MKNIFNKNFFKTLALHASFVAMALGVLSGFGIANAASNAIDKPIALFETTLQTAITSSATSMSLVSGMTKDGTTLASSTYGFIIDEGTAVQEFVRADCTNTTCTGMQRGMSVITGTSTVSALQFAHRRGASVKITDAPLLLKITGIIDGRDTFPNKLQYTSSSTLTFNADNDIPSKYYTDTAVASTTSYLNSGFFKLTSNNTVTGANSFTTGVNTFTVSPIVPTPTTATQAANKSYVDGVAIAGAPISDNTTTGIGRTATSTQYAKGYASTTPYFLTSQYASSTASTTSPIVVVASSTGKIDASFIDNYNFGSGADGDATISASTTLTSDKYYHSLTITSGGTLNTGGYVVYAQSFIANAGTIQNNGANGNTGCTGGSAAIGGAGGAGATLTGGTAGSNGTCNASSNVGVDGTAKNPSMGRSGGGGGASVSGAGSAGGTATTETVSIAIQASSKLVASTTETSVGQVYLLKGTTSGIAWSAPAGAGSGGEATFSSNARGGGSGGGSGGPIFLASPTIINTGTIQSNGGNGGAAATATNGGGGGGGGAGGIIGLVYTSLTNSGTIQMLGGSGGAAPGATAGTAGTAGRLYQVKVTGTAI